MFKRQLELKVVKPSKSETETAPKQAVINEAQIKGAVKMIAVFGVASVAALKLTDALCEIAVNYAPKH